ncbi:MAG: hypothetical protein RLZZ628_4153 [Bacteroidota bacterium]|jgi:hypothetical protein
MKTIFAVICSFLAFIPWTISQMDILACYHKLPIGKEIPIKPISKNAQKYQIEGMTGDPLPAVVDLKNGYAGWLDNGTGGGSVEVEIAKFKKADGTQMVVYKRSTYDGVFNTLDLQAFSVQKENLIPIKEVFPVITINDFLATPDKTIKPENHQKILMGVHFQLKLPRTGTSIIGTVNAQEAENSAIAAPFGKKLLYKKIELLFDKVTGKFKIGKKS